MRLPFGLSTTRFWRFFFGGRALRPNRVLIPAEIFYKSADAYEQLGYSADAAHKMARVLVQSQRDYSTDFTLLERRLDKLDKIEKDTSQMKTEFTALKTEIKFALRIARYVVGVVAAVLAYVTRSLWLKDIMPVPSGRTVGDGPSSRSSDTVSNIT